MAEVAFFGTEWALWRPQPAGRVTRAWSLRVPADPARFLPGRLAALPDQDRAGGNPLYKLLRPRKTRCRDPSQ
jgi:hypothetical protein